jgi:Holliday junction resolvase-like predicted endonuclease
MEHIKLKSFHVGVAAEAFVAAIFARCGYDVSVQYGANQPEYDLIISKEDRMLKISVKGSQDGSWGLTQTYKKGYTYHEAADIWLLRHKPRTAMCFVQFRKTKLNEMPRMYLATPEEVVTRLKGTSNNRGDTILYEFKQWEMNSNGAGSIDKIPEDWNYSIERVEQLLGEYK